MIRVCIAGATGWTGSALVAAVGKSAGFALSGAQPYVAGTLLAAERVLSLKGLIRGLDTLLFQ